MYSNEQAENTDIDLGKKLESNSERESRDTQHRDGGLVWADGELEGFS